MKPQLALCAMLAFTAGCITGCDRIDPYQRPGMWQPEGVNNRNIAVLVQDPHDLLRGRGDTGPPRRSGATAVDRLWRDKVKPLPGEQTQTQTQPGSDNTPGANEANQPALAASPPAGGGP